MSLLGSSRIGKPICLCLILTGVLLLSSVAAMAQQTPPKYDIFAGYQWLNPGGNIPGGPDGMGGLLPFKLPSMGKGGGLAFGYNFHPNFALEGDIGVNLKDQFDVSTFSIGPRFTWRSEGFNLFAHTLLGDNHLTSPVGARNGIGAILGGGIDLPIVKRISLRLIEADYQWARQNYASVVSP